jgi:hypothetical protein
MADLLSKDGIAMQNFMENTSEENLNIYFNDIFSFIIFGQIITIFAILISIPIPQLLPLLVDEVLLEKPAFIVNNLNTKISIRLTCENDKIVVSLYKATITNEEENIVIPKYLVKSNVYKNDEGNYMKCVKE